MARPINPKNRLAARVDVSVDPEVFKARLTEAAAAIPSRVLPRAPTLPLPEIAVASPPVFPPPAGATARERRQHMKLYAPISQSAPDTLRINMDDLPAVGVTEYKRTILRMVRQGRFPKPDGHVGGQRPRAYWFLGTLRRYLETGAA